MGCYVARKPVWMARGRDVHPDQIEISLGQPTQRVQHPKNVLRHKLTPVQTAQITRHWVSLCFSSQGKCGQIQGEKPSGELLQPGPALDSISCCRGAGCCSLCPSAKNILQRDLHLPVCLAETGETTGHIQAHLSTPQPCLRPYPGIRSTKPARS